MQGTMGRHHMADKLTDKQARFVEEYLIDLNATQAAIRAGYSEKTAQVIGAENLSKPMIADAIAKARKKTSDKLEITRERVLIEMARIAFSDPRKMFDEDGQLLPIVDMDDDTVAAIGGVDMNMRSVRGPDGESTNETEGVHKIKVWDKNSALEKLSKHLGLFEQDNAQKAPTIIISKDDAEL